MERKSVVIATVVMVIGGFAVGYYFGTSKPPVADAGPAFSGSEAAQGFASQGPGGGENGAPKAGKLEDLLPRLEAKVAANPNDVEQRLLLARTYGELGKRDQAIGMLRPLYKERPQDVQIAIGLATALMESEKKGELKEAHDLLERIVRAKPETAPMARLYQGEILLKLGQRDRAVSVWQGYLKQMLPADERRQLFEQRIAAARQS